LALALHGMGVVTGMTKGFAAPAGCSSDDQVNKWG
jgi:hypothetical protein